MMNLGGAMRERIPPGEYLAIEGLPKPLVPAPLVELLPSGARAIKTPHQVLEELQDPHAQSIGDRELDLVAAFSRDWSTLDPPEDLSSWGEALGELGVDLHVCQLFADLANRSALGHAEASRILAHPFKPGPPKGTPSKYLFMAIQDSQRYLDDWRLYEAERPDAGRGPSGWGRLRHSRGEKPDPSSSWTERSSGASAWSSSQAPEDPQNAWAGYRQGRWAEHRAEPPAGSSGASSSWQDPNAPPGPSGGASGSSGNPGPYWSA